LNQREAFDGLKAPEGRLLSHAPPPVSGLVDFDDVSYDNHADLLYDLAGKVVATCAAICSSSNVRR
jgi:type III restriction enzyme